MKKTSLILILIIGIAFTVSAARAQDGLALMKVEVGARPAAMGGAFVSVQGDPMSAVYNPAGATGTSKFSASFGHIEYWDNIRLETGYFSARSTNRLFLHGGIKYAAVSDLERRVDPTSQADLFSAHDVSFKGGLAYRITDKISAGFGIGWFVEKIESYRGSAFNADFGIIAAVRPGLNLGASMTNFGSDFRLGFPGGQTSEYISLPTTYRVGGSYRFKDYLGAMDIVVLDDKAHAHFGAEANLHEYLSLRAGYMTGYDTKNFTAGASFYWTQYNLAIDYAFVPYSDNLGTTHLVNITFGI